MTAIPKTSYTLQEYIELEKNSEEKFEYWDGNVWTMSGASLEHNQITRNLGTEFDIQLRGKSCQSFPADMRVKVPSYPPYRYPDLTALCGKVITEKFEGLDLLVNPQLIVEVLSPTTEAFDRGDKFTYYESIESFIEYLLVAQRRPHVTQYVKQESGLWLRADYTSLTDVVECLSVPCRFSLNAIYRDVVFPDAQQRNQNESES
jgi:Uma2 family endonuclease